MSKEDEFKRDLKALLEKYNAEILIVSSWIEIYVDGNELVIGDIDAISKDTDLG